VHVLPPGVGHTDLPAIEYCDEGDGPTAQAGADGQGHVICWVEGGKVGESERHRGEATVIFHSGRNQSSEIQLFMSK